MRNFAGLVVAGVMCMAMQVSAQTPAQAPAQPRASTAPKTGAGAKTGAAAARPYDRVLLRPALLKDKAPETYQVKFSTTRGDFTLTVTRAWAPIGADRFYNLVKHHFYDNMVVFRAVPNFVVQFGISSFPPVSAAWSKATVDDDPVKQSNKKGYITFATAGPKTRTTQVFINRVDNARLDSLGFAPFGEVTEGINVVETFYDEYGDQPTNEQDQIEKNGKTFLDQRYPKLDIIKSAALVGEPAAPVAKRAPAAKAAPAPKNP